MIASLRMTMKKWANKKRGAEAPQSEATEAFVLSPSIESGRDERVVW
jgi:hypothetical protein